MAEFYILSVVTQLMKSKELYCANYHPNELWLAGGPSKCTMCKTATISTLLAITSNELPQYIALYCTKYNADPDENVDQSANYLQCNTINCNAQMIRIYRSWSLQFGKSLITTNRKGLTYVSLQCDWDQSSANTQMKDTLGYAELIAEL